jgi:hypothetical protein
MLILKPHFDATLNRRYSMINRLALLVFITATGLPSIYGQNRPVEAAKADIPRQVKAGEVIKLNESLAVKVSQSTTPSFAGVTVKGEPVVVVIELDAGKESVTFLYKLSPVSRSSEIYLSSGGEKLAPRAVVEDFPSFGDDNDKEVEVLDPKGGSSPSTLEFEGKGSIFLLFDVPKGQAKAPKKFSAIIRTTKSKEEQHSLVVAL